MHNGCILAGDVGSGKTHAALFYYYTTVCGGVPKMRGVDFKPMRTPRDVYVITTAKKRDDLDWQDTAAQFGISRESNQDGVQIHVDSWNNISQYEDVTDAFFIFDENRVVGSGAWVKTFLKLAAANQWIVLSATPGDTWIDYIPVFIANGWYRNRTHFYEEHVEMDPYVKKFPKIKRYHGERKLDRIRASILVEMPFARHTSRHIERVFVDYNEEQWRKVTKERWHVYEDRPLRDVAELQAVMRKVVNTDISRLGEMMKVLEKHPKLIIFYNFNYELEMIRTMATSLNYPIGEWNGQKHQQIPETDKWIYAVQYLAGAEGWNCIETNAIAYWSLNHSWRQFEQSQGRTDRMNTPFNDLYYYVLRSNAKIDDDIWKTLLRKEQFNERAYAQRMWDQFVPF